MDEKLRQDLRAMIRGAYDLQKCRIMLGNRLCMNFRMKLGQKPGKKEETIEDEDNLKLIQSLKKEHRRITDAISKTTIRNFEGQTLIADYTEFVLVGQYIRLEEAERKQFNELKPIIEQQPIWQKFLKDVRGIAHILGGFLIAELPRIETVTYASNYWSYCGLDVAKDGRGRSRRKEHLIEREYTTKDGKKEKRWSTTFNPNVKTKLMGVLAPSFIRCGSRYAEIYYNYKHRLENHAEHKKKTKGHRDAMAKRYMIKMFLVDLYDNWRELEGLPHPGPYSEEKLQMPPHTGDAKKAM